MVMDYELAKVKPLVFSAELGQEEIRLNQLESEVEQREKSLEEAQIEYARDTTGKADTLSPEERKALKQEQKNRMQEAARRLAETEEQLTSMEGDSAKSKLHRKAAQRLLELCHQNGGVYIKVGQHLANLDYLIPQEYIDALSSLFDEAPQSDYEAVRRVIEEELHGKVDALFDRFDPVPFASASLAQVHVAYDKETGKKLAVKVQHAGLRETSAGDIFAVTCVVRLIESVFKDFTFGWIADEIAPHLPQELDFAREGRNSERAAAHIEKSGLECVVPKVIWKNTAERVLTMEFEEGFKATDLNAIEKSGLSKL
jgi:aarF domain-containing kinase